MKIFLIPQIDVLEKYLEDANFDKNDIIKKMENSGFIKNCYLVLCAENIEIFIMFYSKYFKLSFFKKLLFEL